jgi:hypothetical protein
MAADFKFNPPQGGQLDEISIEMLNTSIRETIEIYLSVQEYHRKDESWRVLYSSQT